ncbi:uncharacterized protein B0P05DRAFT_480258 [Gilbertella persicaria]|uniref:uncharacterized protein n=1 Tax=Gilbertella persicaria TaxID=101096 RepID=UPI002220F476|nr:uncharacterized protein B0P05DRAFT_480258 [Gilbertella persicaria]KAI8051069.1 hypothetical protein B0P05DRAFT_480258 [Gilbertella persicaria]
MYTHLAQYQSFCWKHWDITVPNVLFEKKENERMNPTLMGWWGPAKGVPILVFVATDIPCQTIVPATIKKFQDVLQTRVKTMFRALHLIPLKPDNPVEVRSLFLLPSGSQPIIHIVPQAPIEKPPVYGFGEPVSLRSCLQTDPEPVLLYHEYSDKLLKNFVSIWTKTAVSRHPLHARKGDKPVPLPTGLQLASAIVSLASFIFQKPLTEDGVDFKKVITTQFPNTKGMIQQIEVILRKKIKDTIDIERVFSKSHSMDIMQKCNEAYLQDSPPFYTEKYHLWKRNNVMRMYQLLARGPCMEEFAARLSRECDLIWKQGRQSCEQVSLTGRACRLKIGHENETTQKSRDERAFLDTTRHNSGFQFFHACNCGKSQRIREDPFDLQEANITFYQKFTCCLTHGRAALDIRQSTFGESQQLVLKADSIPEDDAVLLCLGPSSAYKNNIGLDKVEGFMTSTNFLIPWSMTTVHEVKLRQQQQEQQQTMTKTAALHDSTEWPVLGKIPTPPKSSPQTSAVASLEAFPALGTNPTHSTPTKQLFDTRRKRHNRARDRIQGLVRGYLGAEYECPQGHRFLSCGEGRVCKLGHVGHPKEHGNYFVHQDLPIHVVCPCNTNVTAQLLRLYVVTPDDAVTISMEPKIKIGSHVVDLGIQQTLFFGPNSMYVLRLPFIYQDEKGDPLAMENAVLLKDYIKFHFKASEKWI